ncbi:MAG: hypothetical protein IKD69_13700 [Solobacterium sp.]|nr:hypothetical protein [Solobacterium sp.]
MYKVKKRDGSIAEFDIQKIINAISRAFIACGRKIDDNVLSLIALRVTSDVEAKSRGEVLDVEAIQDSAEKVLSETGYFDVAKAYILYRKNREYVRNINASSMDYRTTVDHYIRMQADNPSGASVGGMILSSSAGVIANYWLNKIYESEIAAAYRMHDIHIHDLSMLTGYSAGWSLEKLLEKGILPVNGKICYAPAETFEDALEQLAIFACTVSNEWAGPQSFADADILLAPYIAHDGLNREQVREHVRRFVYRLNTSSAWGGQVPYVCLLVNNGMPAAYENRPALYRGEETGKTCGAYQEEAAMFADALMEVLREADGRGKPFAYPLVTLKTGRSAALSDAACALTLRYGSLYFTGDAAGYGYEGCAPGRGLAGIASVNLNRIAWASQDEADFFARLEHMTDLCARSLIVKKRALINFLEHGFYPYSEAYMGTFDNLGGAVGAVIYQPLVFPNWEADDDMEGQALAFMHKVIRQYAGQMPLLVRNVETKAVVQRFRKHDAGLPAAEKEKPLDMFAALDRANERARYFDEICTEITAGDDFLEKEQVRLLVRKVLAGYELPLFQICVPHAYCPRDGYLRGSYETCPVCGMPLDPKALKLRSLAAARKKQYLLFVQKRSDDCMKAQQIMKRHGILYDLVDSTAESALAERMGVGQYPSLLVISGDTQEVFAGLKEIEVYTERQK